MIDEAQAESLAAERVAQLFEGLSADVELRPLDGGWYVAVSFPNESGGVLGGALLFVDELGRLYEYPTSYSLARAREAFAVDHLADAPASRIPPKG